MNITLVTVGKIKEKFYRDAVDEFVKRLSRYCKIRIIEVADENTPNNAPEAIEEQIKNKEGERILKKIERNDFVILFDVQGEMKDSLQFAKFIQNKIDTINGNICFVFYHLDIFDKRSGWQNKNKQIKRIR